MPAALGVDVPRGSTVDDALLPYPGEAAREAELDTWCERAGGTVVELGHSVEGRAIRAARVPSKAADAPRVLVNANIHGPEWIGARVALGVLRALAVGDAERLREVAEVVVVPCVNVDGYARTEARRGRGSLRELRTNANGVDLNRNFPLPRVPLTLWARSVSARLAGSGSADPRRATYRGPAPLSEPEARALDAFCERERFVACASLHSFMGACIPPCLSTSAEARAYATLVKAFARAQPCTRYPRLAGRLVDVTTGELEDRLHHDFGCWAMTIECFTLAASLRQHLRAPSLFWRFNPREPEAVVHNDVPGVIAFLLAALTMPHPRRRGITAGTASPGSITAREFRGRIHP